MAPPKKDQIEAMRIKKVKHATFHSGVQFNGKVYNSLNCKMHASLKPEMYVLMNGCLEVNLDTGNTGDGMEKWIVGSGMWHSVKTEDETKYVSVGSGITERDVSP